jgi:hypothetical protein
MIRTFEEWLNELEGFSLRMERAYDDLVVNPKDEVDNWQNIKQWLKGAFDAGYEAGEFNKLYLIQSLKVEIRTLNKEIAGLREERRSIVDKDFPPGYNANLP